MADPKDNEEEDKVAAAYENISKKLEDIRNGNASDDEDGSDENKKPQNTDDEDLPEWKGPKGVESDEIEVEDIELRKVKLEHTEGDDEDEKDGEDEESESKESDESEAVKDEKADDDSEEEKPSHKHDDEEDDKQSLRSDDLESPAKKWKPEANDPLDEEETGADEKEEDESKESDKSDADEKKPEKDFEPEKFEDEAKLSDESEDSDESKESNDTNESGEGKPKSEYFGEDVKPKHDAERDESEETFTRPTAQPDTLDDLADKTSNEDDDYHIPNLKGARHEQGDMEYNADPSRERHERAYNNMDNMSKDSDPNNFFSQHQQNPKRANKFHLLILVLIGIAVIGFTVYILKGGFGEINITPEASPSPSPVETSSPTPTPTPEPDITRGDFTIRVLNGTSTTGLAGTVSDKLEELGYQTVSPGNATNSAFTQTVIRVKESDDATALFERLKLDLSPDYEAQPSSVLPDNATSDAEVILGTK